MARFSVDSDEVLTATSLVQGTVGRLESESTALLSQLTRLQGSWTGSAAIAFQGVVERWRTTQRQVEESLADINGALTAAGRQYADVEQASTSLFR
ncbi:WXG100 family type VII secretion target [Microbacterium sp. AG1240]|uniref:WXG100 family type VII secretion target n=1 Tax=Microbacterium sp. AG1240 TaxID=2183992 RepID=UPI000EAE6F88|nr:WXG100 family type VII secretion target [Microbacterium sp. AG1240]RKT33491.1 WXG100 family type VII secretion target [Microbacterium sp. AG1240]